VTARTVLKGKINSERKNIRKRKADFFVICKFLFLEVYV